MMVMVAVIIISLTFIITRYKVRWIRNNHLVELLEEWILCGVEEHERRSAFNHSALYEGLLGKKKTNLKHDS